MKNLPVKLGKLTIAFAGLIICFSYGHLNAQAQRQEFTPDERAEIQQVSECDECTDPIKKVFESAREATEEALSGEIAQHFWVDKGIDWITKSEIIATAGSLAYGLLKPSELAGPKLDNRPPSRPSWDRTLQVTCYRNGRPVPCQ